MSHADVHLNGPALASHSRHSDDDVIVKTKPVMPMPKPQKRKEVKPEGVSDAAHHTKLFTIKLVCGLVSGCVQAGVLNPWDRALYLAVKHHRPMFIAENWRNPYQGVLQTLTQRAFSSGIYFPLEDTFRTLVMHYYPDKGEPFTHGILMSFCVGTLAGTVSAVLLNPLSVIKYHTWGRSDVGNFWRSAGRLHRGGGLHVFVKGTTSGMLREISFAAAFCLLRTEGRQRLKAEESQHRHALEFAIDSAAAFAATAVAAPFNYVRTMQFAARSNEAPPAAMTILREMMEAAKSMPTLGERIKYISMRLRIGTGATRVAVGMAIGSQIYDFVKDHWMT